MKQKKYDDAILVKVQSKMKKDVDIILDARGYSISEFVREKLQEVLDSDLLGNKKMTFENKPKQNRKKTEKKSDSLKQGEVVQQKFTFS